MRFVNRERGSGTRPLFDALLRREGLAAASINGCEREDLTHTATASAVRAGTSTLVF